MHIIDRRLNPGGKSLANRQRFLRRAKAAVREAVRESSKGRGIRDMDGGGEVTIPAESVREPRLQRSREGGRRSVVLPGNKKFIAGDALPKEQGGGSGGSGGGQDGAEDGEAQDDFRFVLSESEYLDLFLDDLELPNLAKRTLTTADSRSLQRAGYSVSGSPASLAVGRTMRNSLSRRAALGRPKTADLDALRAEVEALAADDRGEEAEVLRARLDQLSAKTRRVPYIDPIDLRYRRFESVPRPVSQAVMFCLMDTSASMTAHMKDLAKRFFALLYLFLKRRYRHVEIVFIRHTHLAEEVDETTFFHSPETGGTVVSSALEAMRGIVAERFRPENWNVYGAQASDGDNSSMDAARTADLLTGSILPACQYFAYLEVGREGDEGPAMGFMPRRTELWRTYEKTGATGEHFAMCRVAERTDIYPVFRRLFERRQAAGEGASP